MKRMTKAWLLANLRALEHDDLAMVALCPGDISEEVNLAERERRIRDLCESVERYLAKAGRKMCSRCSEVKSFGDFQRRIDRGRETLRGECRECYRARMRRHYESTRLFQKPN